MKATFALLANHDVYNWVRHLAWQIHQTYRTGTHHCRLPPHISLKQPFSVADLAALEGYMDSLASSLVPFEVSFTELQLEPIVAEQTEYGVLWLAVQDTAFLRHLHLRLNAELQQRFGNTQAAYDGNAYRFHLTVMMSGQPFEIYRQVARALAAEPIPLRYTVTELGLFVYDEPLGPNGEYLAYRILPIGRARRPIGSKTAQKN
jgi:2'-5' RNA ligase